MAWNYQCLAGASLMLWHWLYLEIQELVSSWHCSCWYINISQLTALGCYQQPVRLQLHKVIWLPKNTPKFMHHECLCMPLVLRSFRKITHKSVFLSIFCLFIFKYNCFVQYASRENFSDFCQKLVSVLSAPIDDSAFKYVKRAGFISKMSDSKYVQEWAIVMSLLSLPVNT